MPIYVADPIRSPRIGPGAQFTFGISGEAIVAGDSLRMDDTIGLCQGHAVHLVPGMYYPIYITIGWDAELRHIVGPALSGQADGVAIAGFNVVWYRGGSPYETLALPGYVWDPVSHAAVLIGLALNELASSFAHDPMLDDILACVRKTYE